MVWSPKAAVEIVLDKDMKAGEKVAFTGEVKVDQGDIDRMVADRVSREQAKTTEAQQALDKANKDLKELQEKAKATATPDEAQKKQLEEMQKTSADLAKKLQETTDRLAIKETVERVDQALERMGLKLPRTYRKAIEVKVGATEDEIKAAIETVKATYDAEVPEATRKAADDGKKTPAGSAGFGRLGTGGAATDQDAKDKALVERVKRDFPHLFKFISTKNEAGQIAAVKAWDAQGQLKPKATANA